MKTTFMSTLIQEMIYFKDEVINFMKFPSRNEVERLRKEYPAGTMIMLDYMDDSSAPPTGTTGRVTMIDDMGCIHWTGSGLAIVPGVDRFHKIKGE